MSYFRIQGNPKGVTERTQTGKVAHEVAHRLAQIAVRFGGPRAQLLIAPSAEAPAPWSAPATFVAAGAIYILSLRGATRERFVTTTP